MVLLFNIITFIITTCVAFSSIKRIVANNFSIMHICVLIYYIMQCVPLLFELLFGLEFSKGISPIFHRAMTDENVAYLYNILTIITSIVFFIYANKYSKNGYKIISLTNINYPRWFKLITLLGMYLPLVIAVFTSPIPEIYFDYAYFYRIDRGLDTLSRIYHNEVVSKFLIVSFLFTIIRYYTKSKVNLTNCIDVYITVVMITWINQKRTMMMFLLLSFLIIDFLKKNHVSMRTYIKKCIVFLVIIVSYFEFYSNYVKSSFVDFMTTYSLYFSRLNVEKVAIYDILYDNQLLEYKGQSLLYNLFFFIPRTMWPSKPGMYTKSFTAYVESGYGSESYWLPFNYQVNMWGDWVSSLGLIGHIIAILFVLLVIRLSECSNSKIVKISGISFILMYLMFGFEGTVLYAYIIWISSVFYSLKTKRMIFR